MYYNFLTLKLYMAESISWKLLIRVMFREDAHKFYFFSGTTKRGMVGLKPPESLKKTVNPDLSGPKTKKKLFLCVSSLTYPI